MRNSLEKVRRILGRRGRTLGVVLIIVLMWMATGSPARAQGETKLG